MRLVLYNIRYGTGAGPSFHLPVPGAGYLRGTRRNLTRITDFLRQQDPDIVGLIEVDTGSYRSGFVNQAEVIANALNHRHSFQCKYAEESINQRLPVVKRQGNAMLTSQPAIETRFHYFESGIKRLIIELELDDFVVFLVHLSVKFRHRHYQLRHLHELIAASKKPVAVAGDFNTLWGDHELVLFCEAAGLHNANEAALPSYPSWSPKRQLDFVLYGKGLKVDYFAMPQVTYSDHLPLVCDLTTT